ncbi:MAG: deoxyguanosinetriphosphate triphosphohydrolase [Hyphomicrobiales bacterium]|nr:deoxyguanosinetriphosphate triphosphohydrolase [Hyphomicrobiales bacterium]OQW83283.1 MAG: deoxyguanosinetriphosphate triphosphohydrolase [Proteobacteria bacterium ST_bin15]
MAVVGRCASLFSASSQAGRGRLITEPASPTRGDFQRDRDRIIHSTAFRRLKDKTQVFVYDEGDHYRTRLTHTIEVAQISRALARSLGMDEDLAEALALAHDLGHPPFGHSGEDALSACMATYGGFDHNAQALRIVTRLERRYATYDGLNLTWEMLEGLVKHNGPLTARDRTPIGRYQAGLPYGVSDYAGIHDLWLWSWPSAEAQGAAIADDIAYDAHDVDDGLRAGLFTLDDMAQVPLVKDILQQVDDKYPGLENQRRAYEVVRRVITRLIEDVIVESQLRLTGVTGEGADAIRRHDAPVIAFSAAMAQAESELKTFLYHHMYRAGPVMAVRRRAEDAVSRLFLRYMDDPQALPTAWRLAHGGSDPATRARHVCDFVAGMTDRFALQEYVRLFDETADLR